MGSRFVDALENFVTRRTRCGVGEMFVLHMVGELSKIFVTEGTGAWSISEHSWNREIQL